jgi:hypothetical protein
VNSEHLTIGGHNLGSAEPRAAYLTRKDCVVLVVVEPYNPTSASLRSRAVCECGWIEQVWHRDRNGFGLDEAKDAATGHVESCFGVPASSPAA